ncbi:MAG: cation diffusion facilitator family transporter, partial [Candidatus Gracilibacteria bacterium]|nr:cation diffusion facilitator family transporter [Candidatus Gracilibacteria bacterium]
VTWYALAIIIISIVVDFFRSRNLLKVARESGGSQALEADALHFSSDMWSSGAVLVGLVGVLLGFAWADTVGPIAVSVFVLHAGFKLGKRTIEVLIDTAPPGTEARLREIVTGVTGVQFVGTIRVRTMEGTILITEIEVGFPSKMTVGDAFKIKQKVTLAIQETFANAQVIVHSSILD